MKNNPFFQDEAGGGYLPGNEAGAVALLVLPCLFPGLNSFFQLFVPGVAAALLLPGEPRRVLGIIAISYVIGSVIFIALGMPESSLMLSQAVVISVVLLFCLWKGTDAPFTLLLLSTAILVMTLTVMFLVSGGNLASVYAKMTNAMATEFDKAIDAYRKSSGHKVLPPQVEDMVANVKATLLEFFPSIIGGFFIFLGLGNLWSFNYVATRRQGSGILPEFQEWRMPQWLVWVFIVAGFAALLPQQVPSLIGKNGVAIVGVFYFVQGLAVMKFFFKEMETPIYIRLLVYILIGIQWYGLLLVVFTGLMDNWFDFRARLIRNRSKSKDQDNHDE